MDSLYGSVWMEMSMRTTIILSEELVKEAMEITGIKEKTKLVSFGLEEIVRKKRLEELANLFGSQKNNKIPYIKRGR